MSASPYDWAYDVKQTADFGYVVTGTRNIWDVLLIKTDSLGRVASDVQERAPDAARPDLAVAPNPAAGPATITYSLPVTARVSLTLYDATGRLAAALVSGTQTQGLHEYMSGPRRVGCGPCVCPTPGDSGLFRDKEADSDGVASSHATSHKNRQGRGFPRPLVLSSGVVKSVGANSPGPRQSWGKRSPKRSPKHWGMSSPMSSPMHSPHELGEELGEGLPHELPHELGEELTQGLTLKPVRLLSC